MNFDVIADFDHREVRAHFNPPGIGLSCGGQQIIIRRPAEENQVAIFGVNAITERRTNRVVYFVGPYASSGTVRPKTLPMTNRSGNANV